MYFKSVLTISQTCWKTFSSDSVYTNSLRSLCFQTLSQKWKFMQPVLVSLTVFLHTLHLSFVTISSQSHRLPFFSPPIRLILSSPLHSTSLFSSPLLSSPFLSPPLFASSILSSPLSGAVGGSRVISTQSPCQVKQRVINVTMRPPLVFRVQQVLAT